MLGTSFGPTTTRFYFNRMILQLENPRRSAATATASSAYQRRAGHVAVSTSGALAANAALTAPIACVTFEAWCPFHLEFKGTKRTSTILRVLIQRQTLCAQCGARINFTGDMRKDDPMGSALIPNLIFVAFIQACLLQREAVGIDRLK